MEWPRNAVPCESNHGLSLVSAPCVDLKMFPNRIAKWELFWIKEVMSKLGFRQNRVFEKKKTWPSVACMFIRYRAFASAFCFFLQTLLSQTEFRKIKINNRDFIPKKYSLGVEKIEIQWVKNVTKINPSYHLIDPSPLAEEIFKYY